MTVYALVKGHKKDVERLWRDILRSDSSLKIGVFESLDSFLRSVNSPPASEDYFQYIDRVSVPLGDKS